jgi:hypothetical protein
VNEKTRSSANAAPCIVDDDQFMRWPLLSKHVTQTRTLVEVMAVLSTLTLNSVLRGKPLSDSNASVCTLSLAHTT